MAYQLLKTSSQAIVADLPSNTVGVVTFSARIKLLSMPGAGYPDRFCILNRANASSLGYYLMLTASSVTVGFYNTNYVEAPFTASWTVGQWYTIACVWDFSTPTATLKAFVDGVQVGSTFTTTRGTVANTSGSFRIGSAAGDWSNIQIAEVGMWSVELTPVELKTVCFRKPSLIRPASLIREYRLIRELKESRLQTAVSGFNSPTIVDHPRIYP